MQDLNYEFKRKWFEYLGYEPHLGQLALHYPKKADARFQVMVCGVRNLLLFVLILNLINGLL